MARLYLIASLAAALFLGGCAALRPTMSYVEPSVTASDGQTLASDTVAYLSDPLPPARTIIVLDPPATKDRDSLTSAMLPALRKRGYGIELINPKTGKASSAGVPLRYIASPLDDGVLLRLQYQGIEASRFYSRGSNGLLLTDAPFTVRWGAQ